LELTALEHQVRRVVAGLEQKSRDLCSLHEVALGLLQVTLSKLQNAQVVEGLRVIGVAADRDLEALIR
jgi:hypothetical protein